MSFIKKNDYWALIKESELNAIIENNNIDLEGEQLTAILFVKQKLFKLYNTDYIFSRKDSERDMLLVRYCVHIVLYSIYQRIPNARELPLRQMNYIQTISSLDKISQGTDELDAPRKTKDGKQITRFRGGSVLQKRTNSIDDIFTADIEPNLG